MEIRKRFVKNIAVLYLAGNIDENSASFIEETGQLIKESVQKILASFANVNMVDYNGLSVLGIAYKNVVNQNGILKFCDVPLHIKELFKTARLDRVFEIYDNEEDALESFKLSTKIDKLRLRRRFKRIDISVTAVYKEGLAADTKLSKGKVLNMGGDGLFIYSKNTFPVSTQLYLEIGLEKKKPPIALMGTVIWLADKKLQPHAYPGMGVSFVNLDKKTQEQIISFIDRHITRRSQI